MKVLFLSVEVVPFAATGGLGEVAGSLPRALAGLGLDMRVMMPKHRQAALTASDAVRAVDYCPVHMPWWVTGCAVDETRLPRCDVPVYLVEHHQYFDRDPIYGPGGSSYPDNLERFVFFCRAAIESLPGLGWQPDVVHLNDWHVALLALYQKSWSLGWRTVYTAHQLGMAYHGIFPASMQMLAGVDLGRPEARLFVRDGHMDLARAALALADMTNTVSPRYAAEVSQPGSEEGVADIIASRPGRFRGILNGLDYADWSPAADPHIAAPFTAADLTGKRACKTALQQELGLPVDAEAPLVAMVARLDEIKGWRLVWEALPHHPAAQFVLLASPGDESLRGLVEGAHSRHPGARGLVRQDLGLAHRVYAGADLFLMPSLREPCGLAQMVALAYGAVPVAHRTGGLADTVTEGGPHGNGFLFEPARAQELSAALERALTAYADRPGWESLMRRGMACDFSWDRSAREYLHMYEGALAMGA